MEKETRDRHGRTEEFSLMVEASDVTPEILEAAEEASEWFADERMDWDEFLDRLDGCPLNDGSHLDVGPSTESPAINKIKKHIREVRRAT